MAQPETTEEGMSFQEFVSLSRSGAKRPATGPVLHGYFNWRSSAPDYIFFGNSPYICPYQAIERSRVKRFVPLNTFPCTGGEGGNMWSGYIYLKDERDLEYLSGMLATDELTGTGREGLRAPRSPPTFVWYSLE